MVLPPSLSATPDRYILSLHRPAYNQGADCLADTSAPLQDLSGYRLLWGRESRLYGWSRSFPLEAADSSLLRPDGGVVDYFTLGGTLYGILYFTAVARDSFGLEGCPAEEIKVDFGPAPPDTVPPVLSDIHVLDWYFHEDTTMVVKWRTDELADSWVLCQLFGDSASHLVGDTVLVTEPEYHRVVLRGLQFAATYRYRVGSRDTTGNAAISGILTFTTPPDTGAGASAPPGALTRRRWGARPLAGQGENSGAAEVVSPPGPIVFFPNPFSERTQLHLHPEIPGLAPSAEAGGRGSTPPRVLIYTVRGELVRTLPVVGGGVLWDGRDEGGREVPPGVYLCRMEAGGRALLRKVVRTR